MNVRPPGRPEGEYSIAEEGREARRVLWSTTVWTKGACGKGRRRAASSWGLTRRPVGLEPLAALPCGHGRADARSTGQAGEIPPRRWGRLKRSPSLELLHRNTPTCVGKTRGQRHFRKEQEKHPHMRGEDAADRPFMTIVMETPEDVTRKMQKIFILETPPHAWGRQDK